MKTNNFLLLITLIPFLSFAQEMGGSAWKIYQEDGDQTIILFQNKVDAVGFYFEKTENFCCEGTFAYLDVRIQSGTDGIYYADDNETWFVQGKKLVISFNDGYQTLSGTINNSGDYVSGMSMNKKGKSESWYGELIKF